MSLHQFGGIVRQPLTRPAGCDLLYDGGDGERDGWVFGLGGVDEVETQADYVPEVV